MTKEQLIVLVVKALPYPDQMDDLKMEGQEAIRFEWRGSRYRVTIAQRVEEVGDGCLIGSDKAILMERLLKLTYLNED